MAGAYLITLLCISLSNREVHTHPWPLGDGWEWGDSEVITLIQSLVTIGTEKTF